jgi:hypothetical protein
METEEGPGTPPTLIAGDTTGGGGRIDDILMSKKPCKAQVESSRRAPPDHAPLPVTCKHSRQFVHSNPN